MTEYEDSAPLTSVSYGRSRKELRDFRPSETTYASLHNRSMESVNSSADNFKVNRTLIIACYILSLFCVGDLLSTAGHKR